MSSEDGGLICDVVGTCNGLDPDTQTAIRCVIEFIKTRARKINVSEIGMAHTYSFSISKVIAECADAANISADRLLDLLCHEIEKHGGTRNGFVTNVFINCTTKIVAIRVRRA